MLLPSIPRSVFENSKDSLKELVTLKSEYKKELGSQWGLTLEKRTPVIGAIDDSIVVGKTIEGLHTLNMTEFIIFSEQPGKRDSNVVYQNIKSLGTLETWYALDALIICEGEQISRDLIDLCAVTGVIPIISHRVAVLSEIENYDPREEQGDAFIIHHLSEWGVFAAIVRMLETYQFPYDLRTIIEHNIERVSHKKTLPLTD